MDLILSVPPFLYKIPVSHGIEAGKRTRVRVSNMVYVAG